MDDLIQHCLQELAFEGDYGEFVFQSRLCLALLLCFHKATLAEFARSPSNEFDSGYNHHQLFVPLSV